MKLESVGEIIATRELDLAGSEEKLTVSIGIPKKFPDSSDYFCPFEIRRLRSGKVSYAGGIDGIQALLLALKKIGAELYTSEEAKSGALLWKGARKGNLGFPVPDSLSDIVTSSE